MSRATETLAEGRFLRLSSACGWEFVERVGVQDAAALVAVTRDRHLVLVEQHRIPVGSRTIELPAGLVGDQAAARAESLFAAANRELEEETGYRAGRLELLARVPSSTGLTSEIVSILRASDLERVGAGGGVAGEDIAVHLVPISEARDWLQRRERGGVLLDPKIYVGLYFLGAETAT